MSEAPRVGVLALASAVPEHVLSQAEAKEFARSFFDNRGQAELERLLQSYDRAGIETRQLACPIEWLAQGHSFARRNQAYVEVARQLSRRAADSALGAAGVAREDIGAIVFASSTGLATPSLDASLIQQLDLPRSIERVPLWGLGCAGGGAGIARARVLALGLGKPVRVVACELCSLTFVHGDRRTANLIAVGLFGDGAAACVVGPEPWWQPQRGPELLAGYAPLIDRREDVMGWDLEDQGLRVRFLPTIPEIVHERARSLLADAAARVGLDAAALAHLVVHPGGRKVLEAWDRALELTPQRLRHARAVLREHGNMSSPTALFVLERFLTETPATGDAGVLLALGPGFCAEGVVFRW